MAKGDLKHLGIIMDGNRRWAKKAGKPAIEGHRQGYKNLKDLLSAVKDLDIDTVSVYAFSTENWNRSHEEVEGIMGLLRWVMKNELNDLIKEGIRVRWIGSEDRVPKDIIALMRNAEEKTKDLTEGTLAICFNYGGHQEIVDAANKAAESGEISQETITKNLYAPDIAPMDLLIRTSGEKRISNFMLWRMEYAELHFTDTLWPDFSRQELRDIVNDYHGRSRRFGA